MYAKYQEAVDALRHEQLGRKQSEAILQRVCSSWCINLCIIFAQGWCIMISMHFECQYFGSYLMICNKNFRVLILKNFIVFALGFRFLLILPA